jgi:dipeptidyl aminopeptidase/acylaminoacyl peptidase
MWAEMSEAERETLMEEGRIERPSEYSDEPYVFTKKLIEDGRDHLVLRSPVSFAGPVRLLQGTADADVSTETALRLLDHIEGPDVRLTLVQGADHRFSGERELALLIETVEAVS